MKNQNLSVRKLARCGMVAALYVVLCMALQPFSYGAVQVRVAEALCLLPVFGAEYIFGVVLGCFLANLLGSTIVDVIFGTLATLLACLLTVFAVNLVSCGEKEEKKISPLGITEEEYAGTAYDLDQIQEAGELIAVTLSGPDTYYEYKGKGFGLQFELAEHFAVSIGAKLRMEAVRDTAELFQRLKKGEADLIALEIPENHMTDTELQFSGVRSCPSDSTAAVKTGWVVRKDAPFLAEALDGWYKPETRSFLQKREQLRLSPGGSVKRRVRAPFQNRAKGIISPYDTHFIRHSQAIGWDWRLMAAQCYQESGFDPEAVSWAGARGLMQIMPETYEWLASKEGITDVSQEDLLNPEINIKYGQIQRNLV